MTCLVSSLLIGQFHPSDAVAAAGIRRSIDLSQKSTSVRTLHAFYDAPRDVHFALFRGGGRILRCELFDLGTVDLVPHVFAMRLVFPTHCQKRKNRKQENQTHNSLD